LLHPQALAIERSTPIRRCSRKNDRLYQSRVSRYHRIERLIEFARQLCCSICRLGRAAVPNGVASCVLILLLWGGSGCSPEGIDCPRSLYSAWPPSNSPSWHPDGRLITFNHVPIAQIVEYSPECGGCRVRLDYDAAGTYGILDGQAPTRLLQLMFGDPSWSPAGDQLAFEHGRDIFRIDFANGSFDTLSVTQLTFGGNNFNPAWSPDGSLIAYDHVGCSDSDPLVDSTYCGVLVMNPSGAGKTPLVAGDNPSWFPDSRHLLYVGLQYDFFVHDLVDSTATRLTNFGIPGMNNRYPAIAPDGALIAFASQRKTSPVDIWIVEADGSGLRRLTSEGTLTLFCWSPDSEHILYVNYRASDCSEDNGSLWMIDVHSGEKRRLVHGSIE
jgi:Tol biopolymer transport system component